MIFRYHEGTKATNTYLFLEDEGKPAIGEFKLQENGYIYDVLIYDENRRGKGFGSLMMQELINEAQARKIQILYLLVFKDNIAARRLYHKFKFIIHPNKVQLKKGMVVMKRVLWRPNVSNYLSLAKRTT